MIRWLKSLPVFMHSWIPSISRCVLYTLLVTVLRLIFQGSHFFSRNGSPFFVKGLFYSDSGKTTTTTTSFIDVLADEGFCSRDIPYFQKLGINTLLILDVDTRASHSACMLALQKAGIHVLFQLNGRAPGQVWINGAVRQEWGYEYYDHFR